LDYRCAVVSARVNAEPPPIAIRCKPKLAWILDLALSVGIWLEDISSILRIYVFDSLICILVVDITHNNKVKRTCICVIRKQASRFCRIYKQRRSLGGPLWRSHDRRTQRLQRCKQIIFIVIKNKYQFLYIFSFYSISSTA